MEAGNDSYSLMDVYCMYHSFSCDATILVSHEDESMKINIYIAQIPCEYDQMRVTNKYDTN